MRRYDLHLHSKYSYDSVSEPKSIVSIAKSLGLDGIAVTDHNTIKGGLATKEFETLDFEVIVGTEIHTDEGDVIGLYLSEEIIARNLIEVIDEMRAQGATIIIPHPFDENRDSALHPKDDVARLVDGVEGYNSRCRNQLYNELAVTYANTHNLAVVAGSDAHCTREIGNAWTIFDSDLREAIVQRKTQIYGVPSHLVNRWLSKSIKKLKLIGNK